MTATGLGRTAVRRSDVGTVPNENEAVWVQTKTGTAYLSPRKVEAVLYHDALPGVMDSRPSVEVVLTSGTIVPLRDERSYKELAQLLLGDDFPEID